MWSLFAFAMLFHDAAEHLHIPVVDAQQLRLSVVVLENTGAAHIAVEDQRFHGVGIPEAAVLQLGHPLEPPQLRLPVAPIQQRLILAQGHGVGVVIALNIVAAQ